MSQVLQQIEKTKKVATTTAKGKKARITQLVDILGMIDTELEQSDYKALIKQQEMAKKELQQLCDDVLPKDKGRTVKGKKYVAEIKPKSERTEVTDMGKAIKMAGGWAKVKDHVKISLEFLRMYLNPEQLSHITKTDRTGSRPVKIERLQ